MFFTFPDLSSPNEAMQAARKGVARVSGGTVKINTQQEKGNSIVYTGTTSFRNGSNQWVGMFAPTQRGVIGLFVGATKRTFEKNQPINQQTNNTVRIRV